MLFRSVVASRAVTGARGSGYIGASRAGQVRFTSCLAMSDLGSLHYSARRSGLGSLRALQVGLVSRSVGRSCSSTVPASGRVAVGRSQARHSQLTGLSCSPSSRGLETGLLWIRVLFTILAMVTGRALAGAYGSGFDPCLAATP